MSTSQPGTSVLYFKLAVEPNLHHLPRDSEPNSPCTSGQKHAARPPDTSPQPEHPSPLTPSPSPSNAPPAPPHPPSHAKLPSAGTSCHPHPHTFSTPTTGSSP